MLGRGLLAVAVAVMTAAGPLPWARAEEEICVGVVVDFQRLEGAPANPSTHCAKVPNRSTGYDVLLDRARALGRPAPRMENGLLCAIDGLPERGCGDSGGGGYRYWAYFHRLGDGAWQYSNRGAADYRVIDDPARTSDDEPGEGWVWVDGGPEGSVRPAAVPYDEICVPTKAAPSPAPAARASQSTSASPPARRAATATPSRSAGTTARGPLPDARASATTVATGSPAASIGSVPSPSARASSSPSPAPSPNDALIVVGARDDDSSGLPTSTVAGLGFVVVLAGLAALRLRRGAGQ